MVYLLARKTSHNINSSSINYFRYEVYVLVGLVLGLGEQVLYHKGLLVCVVGSEWFFWWYWACLIQAGFPVRTCSQCEHTHALIKIPWACNQAKNVISGATMCSRQIFPPFTPRSGITFYLNIMHDNTWDFLK